MTQPYEVVTPPEHLRVRGERLLDEHTLRLELNPRPALRFVRPSSVGPGALSVPGLLPFEQAAGFVRRSEPNTIYINVAAPLAETLAHEARHIWQAQKLKGDMWASSATRQVEDDAGDYAAVSTMRQSLASSILRRGLAGTVTKGGGG